MPGYQAHEAVTADVKMYWKMVLVGLLLGLLAQALILGFCLRRYYLREFDLHRPGGVSLRISAGALLKYYWMPAFRIFGKENNIPVPRELKPFFGQRRSVTVPAYRATLEYYFGDRLARFKRSLSRALAWSWCAYLLTAAYLCFFLSVSAGMNKARFLRGAVKIPLERLRRALAAAAAKETAPPGTHLQICGLTLPRDLEAKHFLIMGATGTGKSVLFNQLVGQIIARKLRTGAPEKLVIYDVKGEFLSKHYRPGDLIFYPADPRSLKWSFFNEIRCEPDFHIISEIIFRPAKETKGDPFWNNAARAVFIAGLRYLEMKGIKQNRDIWEFFCQTKERLVAAIKQLPRDRQDALKHIEGESEAAEGVLSTLMEKINFFQYLVDQDGDFSFQEFVRRPDQRNLFLMNVSRYAQIWQPLITLACDVMIRETLSLPDTNPRENRRIWFCIDEIGSLHQISVLFDLLTMGRSKGGCMIAASQDLGKIEDVYGRPNKTTFYNNFNTGFFLRINDPDTAEFLSRSIGEQEVIKIMEGRQLSPKDIGDRKSFTEQDKIEKLMLPAEFMRQPDFQAIVKFSAYGISEAGIPRTFFKEQAPPFIDRFRETAPAGDAANRPDARPGQGQ